jgi:drug/metabolite transporter (DMT)-like permease
MHPSRSSPLNPAQPGRGLSPSPPPDRLTDAGLVLLTLIWGANFVVVKWALDAFSPLAFNALRFPLGCAVLALAMVTLRGRLPLPRREDLPGLVFLALLGNVAYQLLFIYGLDATRAGNAALLLATTPVWALLLAILTREGPQARSVWLGIGLTLGGMGLVVVGGSQAVGIEGATLRGDILMVLAAMSWAGYTVGCRRMILRYGAIPVTAWTLWGGTVVLVALGLPDLMAADLDEVGLPAWGAVAFAGMFALGVAYLIWYRAVHRLGSARTAAFTNLIPVVALGLAWVALGEVPTVLQLTGAAVILAGIALARWGSLVRFRGRKHAPPTLPPPPHPGGPALPPEPDPAPGRSHSSGSRETRRSADPRR